MKIETRGYTLIELVMVVSLLVIVLVGGTSIFYRSLKSSGVSDIQASLNNGIRALDEMIERSLRYGTVIRVVGGTGDLLRSDCVGAGLTGVAGTELVVRDPTGGVVTYSLENGVVSSNSAVPISNPDIFVNEISFTWFCRSGVNDKMNIQIKASSTAITGEAVEGSFNKDINLLNSGIN